MNLTDKEKEQLAEIVIREKLSADYDLKKNYISKPYVEKTIEKVRILEKLEKKIEQEKPVKE